eukprot:2285406-Amphidinium_carterae.1
MVIELQRPVLIGTGWTGLQLKFCVRYSWHNQTHIVAQLSGKLAEDANQDTHSWQHRPPCRNHGTGESLTGLQPACAKQQAQRRPTWYVQWPPSTRDSRFMDSFKAIGLLFTQGCAAQ